MPCSFHSLAYPTYPQKPNVGYGSACAENPDPPFGAQVLRLFAFLWNPRQNRSFQEVHPRTRRFVPSRSPNRLSAVLSFSEAMTNQRVRPSVPYSPIFGLNSESKRESARRFRLSLPFSVPTREL